jgi:phosphodiesterase/alkaline phosphatase D-like protein
MDAGEGVTIRLVQAVGRPTLVFRIMKISPALCIPTLILALAAPLLAEETSPVCMANGIKIGEVSADSAIVWTRLTRNPERNLKGRPLVNC